MRRPLALALLGLIVPGLVGRTLPQSRRLLAAKHCRLGRVGKAFSKSK
jgi:hypothetical protein